MTTLPASAQTARRAPVLPAFAQLIRAELLRLFRNPMFAVGTIGFPAMFFALFGLPAIHEYGPKDPTVGPVILVQFAAYSLLSLCMFSFGSAIATERTGGWMRLLRSSPLSLPLYFAAKIASALCFGAVCLAVLYTFAHFAGGVTLSLGLALLTAAKLLLCMIPLVALGLCIGFLANPQAAQILANIVSVIMSFASGLFTPLNQMPAFVQSLAPIMPAYHVGQIAGGTVTHQTAGETGHWLALLLTTFICGALAVWGMKRDESRE